MEQNIFNTVYKVNHAGGSGSCFYLKNYDLFVTNYHVVDGFREVALQDNDKNRFYARVVLVNPAKDIAFLKAEGDFSALPEIALSALDSVSIGQKINVAGYPFGMPFTVTEGTVSSPRQLINDSYYIQTDAAVNPGNSGGPMFNDQDELVAITASKITDADNMGFGIPVTALRELLEQIGDLDTSVYNVQCNSCDEFISDEEEYCPSCGDKLPSNVFQERSLTDLAVFCEEAIQAMGINPVLARVGYESWVFHKGSSEIRMFVYQRSYLFCTSPINVLPKKNLEPVLTYLLNAEVKPYQLGLDGNQIYLSYRIHISDIFSDFAEEIQKNISRLRGYEPTSAFVEKIMQQQLYRNIAKTQYTDDSKVTDHYAIIPTGQLTELNSLNSLQKAVFELIVRRFLSVFYPPAEYQNVKLVVGVDTENHTESFFASAKVLKSPGYLEIAGIPKKKDKNDPDNPNRGLDRVTGGEFSRQESGEDGENEETADPKVLLELADRIQNGDIVEVNGYGIKEGKTSPPKRYTSGSMVLAMENAGQLIEDEELRAQIKGSGIGTSATRAEILKKLFNIKYMALNEKTQVITPTYLGELIYEVVHTSMKQLLNPELTASWEKGLTYVAEGSITPDEYMQKLERFVIGRTYNAVHMGNAYGLRPAFDAVAVFYQNAEKEKKSSRSAKSAGNMKAARATKAGTK